MQAEVTQLAVREDEGGPQGAGQPGFQLDLACPWGRETIAAGSGMGPGVAPFLI